MRHIVNDPIENKSFIYETRDAKEEQLFQALELALKDECPPDRKDYLCMAGEDESQDCEACILRWATKDFGNYRK